MERLRGPINTFSMNSEWYDDDLIPHQTHHAMPFLQMLQGAIQAEETEEEDLLHLHTSRGPVEQHDSCITHASKSNRQSNSRVAGHKRSSCNDEEKKRRKRPRAAASLKKAEEMESQRLTHIAVERNRRQAMNDHLAALRALIPPSFVGRGDQASIIGGAIEFVKELEQHLLSLQSEKQRRTTATATSSSSASNEKDACAAPTTTIQGDFFVSPQYTTYSRFLSGETKGDGGVDVEATVVQEHVNLKVAGRRQAGQLVRAIAALEELRLSVLHLNVATLNDSSIFYCLNLRMEHECKLASKDEIATAVHRIFTYINAS